MNEDKTNLTTEELDDEHIETTDPTETAEEKRFTQLELDDIIRKRIARERKQWDKAQEDNKKLADMDIVERLKLEKEDVEKRLADVSKGTTERLVRAEAKIQALALGVDAKKLPYVLKLAEFDYDTIVREDGEIDGDAIAEAIKNIVKDLPELVTGKEASQRGGSDFSKGNSQSITQEQFKKMSYKDKVNLYNTNPELYRTLTK